MKSIKLPFRKGRLLWTPDNGEATNFASEFFATNLRATKFDGDGKLVHEYDLGSGLVTNAGVAQLAYDWFWASGSNTLKLQNFHASGTGATAAAATDIQLLTSAGPTPVAGTQSNPSVAATAQYKTQATLAYSSTLAITEWGLFGNGTLTATTGTPFTATSASSATVTGTPLGVNSFSGFIVQSGTVWAQIASNTSSVLTLGPAGWTTTSTGAAGSTPGSTAAYTLQPTMWDHKVFAAINVLNGDSIQFTYTLTCTSGG